MKSLPEVVVPREEDVVKFDVVDVEESRTVLAISIRQIANGFLVDYSARNNVTDELIDEEYAFGTYADVLDFLHTIGE